MNSRADASNTLHVLNLSQDVTEKDLLDRLSLAGEIVDLQIKRSLTTKRIKYAIVKFRKESDAKRAFEKFNRGMFGMLNGKRMKIMRLQCKRSLKKSGVETILRNLGVGTIFINNLDKEVDKMIMYNIFSKFGNILCWSTPTNKMGKCSGRGFVQFETEEQAKTAIENANGRVIFGKKIYVAKFNSQKEWENQVDDFTNIFIKNNDESLEDKFGSIKNRTITRRDEASKVFDLVDFEDIFASEELDNKEVASQTLFVEARKKDERENSIESKCSEIYLRNCRSNPVFTLYIRNLDGSIDDDSLRRQFSLYQTVTIARVMKHDDDTSKGYGYVHFSSEEEAKRALSEMNNKIVGTKSLSIALAQKIEETKFKRLVQCIQNANRKAMKQFHQVY